MWQAVAQPSVNVFSVVVAKPPTNQPIIRIVLGLTEPAFSGLYLNAYDQPQVKEPLISGHRE
ncbi:hypothetical protein GCM10023191_005450 [Actinoallomurus oryzae]|uniref:Uncharacterized protein n=1 Tax=Actinoallomurus oryzae TaxID=502180 RepID=A0ABP8PAX6_9ACTN